MGFIGILFMLSWMLKHDYLDTCFVSYVHVFCIFVFAPFNAIEHDSHGKAL